MNSSHPRRPQRTCPGVYRATVVNATDPQQAHRVQLTIPSVSASPSTWAPTIRDVAGRPQVGDEVLVGFEAADPDFPYVIGVLSTAPGSSVEISDDGGNSVRLSPSGIELTTSGDVRVTASQVRVSAGLAEVDAGMCDFSGVVKASALIADSVTAASYSPGAGNIW